MAESAASGLPSRAYAAAISRPARAHMPCPWFSIVRADLRRDLRVGVLQPEGEEARARRLPPLGILQAAERLEKRRRRIEDDPVEEDESRHALGAEPPSQAEGDPAGVRHADGNERLDSGGLDDGGRRGDELAKAVLAFRGLGLSVARKVDGEDPALLRRQGQERVKLRAAVAPSVEEQQSRIARAGDVVSIRAPLEVASGMSGTSR